jgi:hypothetical protein
MDREIKKIKNEKEIYQTVFPEEIYCDILFFVDREYIISFKQVSKSWYNYITPLIIDFKIDKIEKANKIAELYPNITHLSLTNLGSARNLKNFINLKTLVLQGIRPESYHLHELPITSLTWIGNDSIEKLCLSRLFQEINKSKTIKSLTIKDKYGTCRECRPEYRLLDKLEELIMINIEYNHYDMLKKILKFPNLKKLTLINVEFYDTPDCGFLELANTSIEYVEISRDWLTSKEMIELQEKFLATGRTIKFNYTPITFRESRDE